MTLARPLLLLAALGLGLTFAACAEVGRPPGGPVDRTPPELVGVSPESLAVAVDPKAPLRITFSEKVDRQRAKRAVKTVPDLDLGNARFDDTTIEFRPEGGWPADTVVVWVLTPDLPDNHGVKLGREVSGAFTTGPSFPPGVIRGQASLPEVPRLRPEPSRADDEDTGPDWTTLRAELDRPPPEGARRPVRWRSAAGDERGHFELPWLDLPSGPFTLTVYLDANGNTRRDEREPVATVDSLFLGEADSIFAVEPERLALVNLEGPVDFLLCLESVEVDTLAIRFWTWPEEADQPRVAQVDSNGCAIVSVVPGELRFGAWIDLDLDGAFGADSLGIQEPFAWPDTVLVQAARPDSARIAWPASSVSTAAFDSLRPPPVPEELFSTPPRGP